MPASRPPVRIQVDSQAIADVLQEVGISAEVGDDVTVAQYVAAEQRAAGREASARQALSDRLASSLDIPPEILAGESRPRRSLESVARTIEGLTRTLNLAPAAAGGLMRSVLGYADQWEHEHPNPQPDVETSDNPQPPVETPAENPPGWDDPLASPVDDVAEWRRFYTAAPYASGGYLPADAWGYREPLTAPGGLCSPLEPVYDLTVDVDGNVMGRLSEPSAHRRVRRPAERNRVDNRTPVRHNEDVPTSPLITTHDHLNQAAQDEALRLRDTGMSWNEVADAMGWERTTSGGYSVARWAAYQARQRLGLMPQRQPRNRAERRATTRNAIDEGRFPSLVQRRFGIEVEFNRGRGGAYHYDMQRDIVAAAVDLGLRAELESYNHTTRTYWKMTTDATVTGGEFVSPPMRTSDGLRQVRLAFQAVKAHGGTTGRNCGMHVHHDVTDFTQAQLTNLISNLRRVERPVMAYVAPERYDGSNACGANLISPYGWDVLEGNARTGRLTVQGRGSRSRTAGCGVTRYASFNFNSTLTYGTVEFRGLGNTLNVTKVEPWVIVTQAIVEHSRLGHVFADGQTVDTMLAELVSRDLITTRIASKFRAIATPEREAAIASAPARAA